MYSFSNATSGIPNSTSNSHPGKSGIQNSTSNLKPCTPCSVKNHKTLPNSNEINTFTNLEPRRPLQLPSRRPSTLQLKECHPCSVRHNKILPNSNFNEKNTFNNVEARRPSNSTLQVENQPNFNSNIINPSTNPDIRRLQKLTPQVENQTNFNSNMINTFTNPDIRRLQNLIPQVENQQDFNSNMTTFANSGTRRAQNSISQACTPCSVKNNGIQSNSPQVQDVRMNFQENIHPLERNLSRNNTSNSFVNENNTNSTNTDSNMGFNNGLNHGTVALKSTDFDELIQAFSPENQEINQSKKLQNNRGKASFQIKKFKDSDFDELMRALADDHCSVTSSDCSSLYNETVENDMKKFSKLKLECSDSSNQKKAPRFDGELNKTFLVNNNDIKISEKMTNSSNDTRKIGKLSGDCCKTSAQNVISRSTDYDELIRAFTDDINNKSNQETPISSNNTSQSNYINGKLRGNCCGGSNHTKSTGYDKLIEIFSSTNNNRFNEKVSNQAKDGDQSINHLKPEHVEIPEKSDVMKTLKAQQNSIENKLKSEKQIEEDFLSKTSTSRDSEITLSDNIDELLQVYSGKRESDFNNMTIDDTQCQKCPSKKSIQENEKEKEDDEIKANPLPKSKFKHVIQLLNQLAPTPLKRIPPKEEENKKELPLMNEQINCTLKQIQEVDKRAADLFLDLICREKQCPNSRRQKKLQNVLRKLCKDEERSERGIGRRDFLNPNIQRSIMNTRRLIQKRAARRYSCKDSPLIC